MDTSAYFSAIEAAGSKREERLRMLVRYAESKQPAVVGIGPMDMRKWSESVCAAFDKYFGPSSDAPISNESELECVEFCIPAMIECWRLEDAQMLALRLGGELPWNDQVKNVFWKGQDTNRVKRKLEEGRGKELSVFAELGAGLKSISTRLQRWAGGTPDIPRDESIVEAAPRLLTIEECKEVLDDPKLIQEFTARKDNIGAYEGALVGVGIGALEAYQLLQLDNSVLDALTFSRAGAPETLPEFAAATDGLESSQGLLNNVSGYTAEQDVAIHYSAAGHEVTFPDVSNNAGWDLRIDGEVFQVKNVAGPSTINAHFAEYPDIPVIANAEMAEHFDGNSMVIIDQALSHADVSDRVLETAEALEHFDGFDSTLAAIPFLTMGLSALRHYRDYRDKLIDEGVYGKRVLTDTVARGGGGAIGGGLGVYIGLVGGPFGALIGGLVGGFLGTNL
ncbi:MAG: hypothetical protein KDB07_02495, partial [Planctomycetes bacterium]|nr:hypothetical protein [Planctomycetota bacterium]